MELGVKVVANAAEFHVDNAKMDALHLGLVDAVGRPTRETVGQTVQAFHDHPSTRLGLLGVDKE